MKGKLLEGFREEKTRIEFKRCLIFDSNDHYFLPLPFLSHLFLPSLIPPTDSGSRTVAMKEPTRNNLFNISVTLIQGYPPAIRVSWNINGSKPLVQNVSSPHISLNPIEDEMIGLEQEIGSRIKTFQVSYHPIFSRSVGFHNLFFFSICIPSRVFS